MIPNAANASTPPCPGCTCVQAHSAHAVLAALRADDLDSAMALGLIEAQPCPDCSDACKARLIAARDARRAALATRERYRAREARLSRIKAERAAARRPAPASTEVQRTPALPKAASDALAKALAKARERHA